MKMKLIASSCAALVMSATAFASEPQPSTGHWMTTCDSTTYFYCGVASSTASGIVAQGFYPATPFPVSLVASCPGGTHSISTKPTKSAIFYSYAYDSSSKGYEFSEVTSPPRSCSKIHQAPASQPSDITTR